MRHEISIARFGRYLEHLINLEQVVAAYGLSEQIQPRAKCMVFDRNHGTWEGTGAVRGQAFTSIPGGHLGVQLNGSARVRIPHDGSGFVMEGDSGGRTLSGAFGDFDIFSLICTTQNDSTLRPIVQKQETNSSGNGWHKAMKDGQLRGYGKVGGVELFNFGRDYPITDGLEHIVQLHISVANGFARLIVDGVPLGADEPFSGELEINGGDCLIGMFNDVVPGDGFIGRVAMVAMSREGNPDICADLHRTRTWHDITKDVRVDTAPAQAKHGTWDQSPLAFTAAPGLMMFSLDNSNLNDAGKQGGFTPGHANCLPGFKEGIPIKWDIRDDAGALHPQFRGFIESIDIETGTARGQRVELLAATWFKRAMEAWVRQLPVQVNLRSDDALRWVMDQCERPPMAVDLAVGESTFPIVFDDIDPEEFVYTVMARVTVNEGGRLYERLDGTVAYEARPTRFLKITPDAVWSQYELEALDAKRAKEQVVNLARVSYRPARVGATATTELASMSQRVEVPPNRSLPVTVELTYRDPTQPSAEVGGMDIQTPVANTDYTMNTQADGQGDDITAFAEVSMPDAVRGGSSVKVTVRNTHHVFVGYFMTRIRGRDLKRFDEQQFEVRDDASIFQNDPKPLGIAFDYQTNEDEAKAIAGQVVALRKEPFMAPRIATRRNIDPDILEDMLVREMGDMVSLSEDMSGLDGSQRTFIDGRELIAGGPDGELVATYAVTRAPAAQSFWILEEEGYSELDETTVLG